MIRVRSLSKIFKARGSRVVALDSIDLDVGGGELLVLLGSSGSGKSTLLRCVAGLERADEGSISVDDQVVWDAQNGIDQSPNRRRIGMVFQQYALWPHMTVMDNVRYPLRVTRQGRAEGRTQAKTRVMDMLGLVGCGELANRYPGELSGGQQQRVSLARALVGAPRVVLFDEPLSNIDSQLRGDLRREIARLHMELHFTGIYVTHDQSEAFIVGDRVAVLNRGSLEQIGEPETIFNEPQTELVAQFLGVRNRICLAKAPEFAALRSTLTRAGIGPSEEVVLRWRPEFTELAGSEDGVFDLIPGLLRLGAGTITERHYGGEWTEYVLNCGTAVVIARHQLRDHRWTIGDAVEVGVRSDRLLIYDKGQYSSEGAIALRSVLTRAPT